MDLGANTGVFSLVAKSVNPNAKVYAFEPVKRVFDKLRQNVRLNGYDVQCVEMAVSNNDGNAVIYDMDTEHILSVTVNHNYLDPSIKVHEVPIETICLNTFIRENNIPNIDLMKIDVETHEPQVLEGFSDYLSRFRPTMLIEILNNEIGEKVEGMIKGLGYLFYNIDENKGIRKVDKIEKSDYFNYLLCNEKIARGLKLPV
jgi:FkbM family methyltransferase